VMRAGEILEAIGKAPRWDKVSFADRALSTPDQGLAVLAYEALGSRAGAGDYRCLCTSTYRSKDGRWLLVQHQQTPI